jgi:hypothetical protein
MHGVTMKISNRLHIFFYWSLIVAFCSLVLLQINVLMLQLFIESIIIIIIIITAIIISSVCHS